MTDLSAAAHELTPADVPDFAPPSKELIDTTCAEYDSALRMFQAAKELLDEHKERIVLLVDRYGYAPAGSEQSMRIDGNLATATITRSTTTTVNTAAANDLDLYLCTRSETAAIFNRLFARTTKFTFVEGAADALKTVALPARVSAKVAELFGKAISVKTNAPSVKVQLLEAEKPVRKPRGKKAVA